MEDFTTCALCGTAAGQSSLANSSEKEKSHE